MSLAENKIPKRDEQGFTLSFAVILCIVFVGLLYTIFYFLKINIRESDAAIFREKAIYLAESGNNRAMARLNVKTLPDIEGLNLDDGGGDEEEDDDELFDEEFFGEDDFDEEEDDFDEEELDELFDEDDKTFLTKIPRYINFYLKEPFYVNIDTGSVITEQAYLALVAQQQARIETNKQQAQEEGITDYKPDEILIEELYFPLPEVNVSKIGTIPIKKGVHLKPGFKITLAEKVPIQIKQDSIVNEYYNFVPEFEFKPEKAVLSSISPNYARPGDYLDIYFKGDNFDDGSQPIFSSADIAILEYSSGTVSIGISEKAKPGRVEMKLGANKTNFYIVPVETQDPTAIIKEILLAKPIDGERQFIKIGSKDLVSGVKITGENLSIKGQPPVIVPDDGNIIIDIVSYKQNELVISIETKKASVGIHYFSIFTEGGQSSSWAFNVEQNIETADDHNPDIGSYSTVATLLEVVSLANLPIRSFIEASSSGRPGNGRDEATGTGTTSKSRPGEDKGNAKKGKRTFDLLKSDLELVWQIETIATVNKKSFKETRIVRRSVPRAEAGLITNSEISFSQSSIIFEGFLEALTLLKDPSSAGDKEIFVEGEDPNESIYGARDENPELIPTGSAVVEDFFLTNRGKSPSAKGFKKSGIVTVVGSNNKGSFSDYGFIESTGPESITIKDPGFLESHFSGDEVIQFTPAIITPERIREKDAERNIDPPGAVAFIPGKENFEYIFRTKLEKLASWGGGFTTSTKVPDDFDEVYEGYFGMTIISGTPSYTGSNSLYGQGLLIIDTTKGGINPSGSTVTLGGSSKLPSMFEGVIYIIGELDISGPLELTGSIIVNSPRDNTTIRVSGSGNVSYNLESIKKAIIHIPFTDDLRTRIIEPVSDQSEILEKKK
jgi:hypothetical protein